MRRPAVLAFTVFAIAASLPAEVRECLPMTAACAHRASARGSSCSRAAACRLHPTPPVTIGAQPALPAPTFVVLFETLPVPAPAEASRAGWREAPTLPPRASPAATPRSPRPPPFTV
jgi:hypothetical protein